MSAVNYLNKPIYSISNWQRLRVGNYRQVLIKYIDKNLLI